MAVRFAGPGLGGPIEGFLALGPDGSTIRAVTFSHQEEVPGLGGEIAAPWFRKQFAGKAFSRTGTPIAIVAPGAFFTLEILIAVFNTLKQPQATEAKK